MRTLVWDTKGSLLLIVSGDAAMTDEEFESCCSTTERLGKEHSPVRVFVVTGKAAVTPWQRKRSGEMSKHVKVRCATVAGHIVTRAVVKLFSIFMDIRAFPPSELEQAADFLEATPEERAWLLAGVVRLQRELTS